MAKGLSKCIYLTAQGAHFNAIKMITFNDHHNLPKFNQHHLRYCK